MTVYDLAMSLEEDDRYRKLEREYDEATQALATELAGARTEANRLEAENQRLREDIDVVIYHAENLQRIRNQIPVRDLDESSMAFANVKRSRALDETQQQENDRG